MRLFTLLLVLGVGGQSLCAAEPAKPPTLSGAPEVESILRYVPDDADLLVLIPRPDSLAGGMAAFGQAIGVAPLAKLTALDILDEPLGERARAIDLSAPLAIALSASDPEPLLVARITAAARWDDEQRTAQLAGDTVLHELGDGGCVAVGPTGVAVFARERAGVERALSASGHWRRRFIQENADLLARRQIVVRVNVRPFCGFIERYLGVAEASAYMGVGTGSPESETALQFSKWMFERLRQLIHETETYTIAASVSDRGVFLEDRATFRPDGEVARYLRKIRRSDRDLLRGLPADGAALIFATEWELPPEARSLNETLTQVLLRSETVSQRGDRVKFEAAMQRSAEAQRKTSGYSGMLAPGPGGQGILYSGLYLTNAVDALRQDVRAVCEMCPDLMETWGALPSARVHHQREKLTGVEADVYTFERAKDAPPTQPLVDAFYGPDTALYMIPRPEGLAYVLGPRDAARQHITRIAAGEMPALNKDPRVLGLLRQFSPHPQFCLLADVPRCVQILATLVRGLGLPCPPLPATDRPTPLAGLMFYLDGQDMRSELFIPAAPIRQIKEGIERLEAGPGAY